MALCLNVILMKFINLPAFLHSVFSLFITLSPRATQQHSMASTDNNPLTSSGQETSSGPDLYELMLQTWFKGKEYVGPGSTLPVCPKCHRVKYKRRWAKEVLHKPNPTAKHVCKIFCASYATCPTQRKDLHPKIQQKEKEEKASHQLSTHQYKLGRSTRDGLPSRQQKQWKQRKQQKMRLRQLFHHILKLKCKPLKGLAR